MNAFSDAVHPRRLIFHRLVQKEEIVETQQVEIQRLREDLFACKAQSEAHEREANRQRKDAEDFKSKLKDAGQEVQELRDKVSGGISRCVLRYLYCQSCGTHSGTQRLHQEEVRYKVREVVSETSVPTWSLGLGREI